MKKITSLVVVVLTFFFFVSSGAMAAGTPKRRGESIVSSQASSVSTSSAPSTGASNSRFGLGFTTIIIGDTTPALSGQLDMSEKDTLQFILGVESSSPFNFGVGSAYKRTVSGGQLSGFHLGGGFNLGTRTVGAKPDAFYLNLSPLAGFHFAIPGVSQLLISADGGPIFQILDGNFNFVLSQASTILGLSVHWFF